MTSSCNQTAYLRPARRQLRERRSGRPDRRPDRQLLRKVSACQGDTQTRRACRLGASRGECVESPAGKQINLFGAVRTAMPNDRDRRQRAVLRVCRDCRVGGPPDGCRVLAGKITVGGWDCAVAAYPGHASSNAGHRRRQGHRGHNMCRWRGGGAEKAWRKRRLAAGPGPVIEWWQAGWENQDPLAAVAAGFSSPDGKRK